MIESLLLGITLFFYGMMFLDIKEIYKYWRENDNIQQGKIDSHWTHLWETIKEGWEWAIYYTRKKNKNN